MNGTGSGRVTPSTRDLALLHRLQQRRLGLRRRAVDLVGEQDVREHRPAPELELAGLRVVDERAGHVARHEVRGELHALGVQVAARWLSVRTSSVFATPGTPSSSTCPPASSAMIRPVTAPSWPTTALPTSVRTCASFSRSSAIRGDSACGALRRSGPGVSCGSGAAERRCRTPARGAGGLLGRPADTAGRTVSEWSCRVLPVRSVGQAECGCRHQRPSVGAGRRRRSPRPPGRAGRRTAARTSRSVVGSASRRMPRTSTGFRPVADAAASDTSSTAAVRGSPSASPSRPIGADPQGVDGARAGGGALVEPGRGPPSSRRPAPSPAGLSTTSGPKRRPRQTSPTSAVSTRSERARERARPGSVRRGWAARMPRRRRASGRYQTSGRFSPSRPRASAALPCSTTASLVSRSDGPSSVRVVRAVGSATSAERRRCRAGKQRSASASSGDGEGRGRG